MKRVLLLGFVALFILCLAPAPAMAQRAFDQAVAITDDITPPRLLEVATPDYTEDAKRHKISGDVVVLIVVDTKGDVIEAKVVKGLGHGLDENAIAAVREWKYKPATRDDKPVMVKMEVTLNFYPPM
jgi:protein TonB